MIRLDRGLHTMGFCAGEKQVRLDCCIHPSERVVPAMLAEDISVIEKYAAVVCEVLQVRECAGCLFHSAIIRLRRFQYFQGSASDASFSYIPRY
jgi:hypothetical protein